MPFIPHTKEDVAEMLASIGAKTIEELFDEIPKELISGQLSGVPIGLSEMEITRLMMERPVRTGFTRTSSEPGHMNIIFLLQSGKSPREESFIPRIHHTRLKPVKAPCSYCTNIRP